MKLIIFGASGTVGKQLLLQSLAQGYLVTAFVRDRKKLNGLVHPNLKVAEGDVLIKSSVDKAVAGHDAVLCALGAGRKAVVRSEGTKNIIDAMQKNGIRRLICQTTLGCGESRGNLNFFWKRIMFGWYLKESYKDHELQEQHIFQSNLNWTIVRPGAFTNGKLTGQFRHGFPSDDKSIKAKISRVDLAMFMLDQLQSDRYMMKAPGLSY